MIPSHPPRNTRYRQQGGVVAALAAGALVVLLGVQCGQLWLLLAGGVLIGLICAGAVLGVATLRELGHAGSSLVGPVLKLDLVRTSRRGRTFLFRTAYAFALLVVLYLLYRQWFGDEAAVPWDLSTRPRISLKETARFAESFFHAFLLAQLGAVFVFTPAYVAGVIAEEKDRRTLEFLFVSDLTDREIVYSKLAARLLHLVLLLLTGLPVLLFATFFGGIDPSLVLAGFVSNGLTMLSLAGTSLLCSVYSDRTLTALLSAYVVAAGHLLCCGVGCLPLWGGRGFYLPLMMVFEAGPIFGILIAMVLHGWLAAMCCHWAGLRLRAWYRIRIISTAAAAALEQRTAATRSARPAVGDDALSWKERYFAPGLGFSASVRATFGEVMPPTAARWVFLIFLMLMWLHLSYFSGDGSRATRELVAGVSTWVLCGMVLIAGVRAATSLGQERDRRTLDGLLTLPVENRAILAAKWRASVWSVRHGGWLLALIWLPALFSSWGPHWLTVPLQVLAGGVYLAFATSLGLWFSLVCGTTLRAVIWTVAVLFGLSVVPLWRELSPVATLGVIAFGVDRHSLAQAILDGIQLGTTTLQLLLYAGMAWGLWALTNARFGPVTGRMPYGSPSAPR